MAPPKAAALIWRDYVINLNPSSGPNKPVKAEVREWGAWIETSIDTNAGGITTLTNADTAIRARLTTVETAQATGALYFATYAEMAAKTSIANQGAEVPDTDTGTHTDPVTGATLTKNGGRFSYSTSPAGWKRVGDTAAASLSKAITTTTLAAAATALPVFVDPATGKLVDLTAADFKTFIQGLAMEPPIYVTYVRDAVATKQSKTILVGDPDRKSLLAQCQNADLAWNFSGGVASFDDNSKCFIQLAGEAIDHGRIGTSSVSVLARTPGGVDDGSPITAPVFVRLERTSTTPLANDPTADNIMAYWTDPVDERFRTAMRTCLNALNSAGILSKLKYGFIAGATANNNAINLCNPAGPTLTYQPGTKGITTVPYGWVKGGGTDAYIDTGLSPSALGITLDSHLMAAKIADTTIDADGFIMGHSVNFYLQPNRSTTQAGFRSGGGLDLGNAAPGSFVALSRNSADAYDQIVDGNKIATITRSLAAVPTATMRLLAIGATAGAANNSILPLRTAWAGPGLTVASNLTLVTEVNKVLAVCDQIRAGG